MYRITCNRLLAGTLSVPHLSRPQPFLDLINLLLIADCFFHLINHFQAQEEEVIIPGRRIMKMGGGVPTDIAAAAAGGGGGRSGGEGRGGGRGAAASAPANRGPVVGDGGLSWRLKALARAKSAAANDGRDLSSVVAERWGSLGDLTSTLSEGGRAANGRTVRDGVSR